MLDRRAFLTGMGAMGGLVALSGCTWTPRNAQEQGATESASASPEAEPEEPTTADAPDLDDGLVPIAGGSFLLGSPDDEPWRLDDETLHEVTIADFYLAPKEVTCSEYAELMGEVDAEGNVPIAGISWYDAVAYCNALSERAGLTPAYTIDGDAVTWDLSADGYRLPTEAEWEYACRAGTTGTFNIDGSPSADEANYYGHYPYEIEGNYCTAQAKHKDCRGRGDGCGPGGAHGDGDRPGGSPRVVWDCALCAGYHPHRAQQALDRDCRAGHRGYRFSVRAAKGANWGWEGMSKAV